MEGLETCMSRGDMVHLDTLRGTIFDEAYLPYLMQPDADLKLHGGTRCVQ